MITIKDIINKGNTLYQEKSQEKGEAIDNKDFTREFIQSDYFFIASNSLCEDEYKLLMSIILDKKNLDKADLVGIALELQYSFMLTIEITDNRKKAIKEYYGCWLNTAKDEITAEKPYLFGENKEDDIFFIKDYRIIPNISWRDLVEG